MGEFQPCLSLVAIARRDVRRYARRRGGHGLEGKGACAWATHAAASAAATRIRWMKVMVVSLRDRVCDRSIARPRHSSTERGDGGRCRVQRGTEDACPCLVIDPGARIIASKLDSRRRANRKGVGMPTPKALCGVECRIVCRQTLFTPLVFKMPNALRSAVISRSMKRSVSVIMALQ